MAHGFGHGPFGHLHFGRVPVVFEALFRGLPEGWRDADLDNGDFLKKLALAADSALYGVVRKTEGIADLHDPARASTRLLDAMARDIGLEPAEGDTVLFRRTAIEMAHWWYRNKGTVAAYKMMAYVHGFVLEIVSLWWDGSAYSETGPTFEVAYDTIPADIVYADTDPLDPEATSSIPITNLYSMVLGGGSGGLRKTNKLRLTLTPGWIGEELVVDAVALLANCMARLASEVKPAHVEFESITYSIPISFTMTPTVTITMDGSMEIFAYLGDYFDVIAADEQPTEGNMTVTGTATLS